MTVDQFFEAASIYIGIGFALIGLLWLWATESKFNVAPYASLRYDKRRAHTSSGAKSK
jgi:hypothetical protein